MSAATAAPEETAAEAAERHAAKKKPAQGRTPRKRGGGTGTKPKDRPAIPAVTGVVVDDVDLNLDERNILTVTLGGHKWKATEPTIEVQLAIAQVSPGDGSDAAAAKEALESLYPQVAEVLQDLETGKPPSREFVQKHLTMRNFGRLMERLNEDAQEGNG